MSENDEDWASIDAVMRRISAAWFTFGMIVGLSAGLVLGVLLSMRFLVR